MDPHRCNAEQLLKGLDTFNKVIMGLPDEVKVRPVKHQCCVTLDKRRDTPVLMAICDKPGIYSRPSSTNQLWCMRPEVPIVWDTTDSETVLKKP